MILTKDEIAAIKMSVEKGLRHGWLAPEDWEKRLYDSHEALRELAQRAWASVGFELGHWNKRLKEAQADHNEKRCKLYQEYVDSLTDLSDDLRAAVRREP